MGFRYKGKEVTLENYKVIFQNCTPDIQDEIRSAVLDSTNIEKYIELCGDDSYKLSQIRLCLREGVPYEYINVGITGKTLNIIRKAVRKDMDISDILRYMKKGIVSIDPVSLETLTEFLYLGADIAKVDFRKIPDSLIPKVCQGLLKGYPMWLFEDSKITLTEEYLNLMMKAMRLEIDIYPFLDEYWKDRQLFIIMRNVNSTNINEFLPYVSAKFDEDCLAVLVQLFSSNVPIESLCVVDEEGYPIYNSFQMYEIGQAIADNTVTMEMYNAKLSDKDISVMHEKELEKKNKKLTFALNPKGSA